MGYMEKGKWWVSPSNYADEVISELNFPEKVEILDTTLRDGEQQPGIVFTRQDKVRIARKLAEVGVHRIEAGTPAVSREDADAIKEISDLNLGPKIFCFVRNMVKDMELAKECGVDGVLAEVPGSEHLLKFGKKWTADKAIKAAIEATTAAHELGLYVTFFPADSSRAGIDFLLDTLQAIEEEGHMDAVALVDTFGAFSPEGAAYRVRRMRERFSQPIEVHFHDDFALGTATTIAGLAAGAQVCHVSVNGIGERAGGAGLETVTMALEALYGIDTGIDTSKLKELSLLVEELSNFKMQANRAVVGDRIFGWETGLPSSLWLNARDTEPLAMLPYLWTMTGQSEPEIYLGKKSGKDNLKKWLADNKLSIAEEKEGDLLVMVKSLSIELKRDLTRDEFKDLVKKVASAE
jgi:isopropylmalate/homocitrate/citramalate synthase